MLGMSHEVEWGYFDKLLENPQIEKMNMLEVCKFIFEATYIKYSIKYFEELYLREKYERKIIEKNGIIEKLEAEIKELKGEHIPEEASGVDSPTT